MEYGSSFSAIRAAGTTQSIRDAIFGMNQEHLSPRAVTVFEALEAAGLVTAAVNMVCYRGPARHVPTVPWLTRPAFGPTRFFYYNLFESDVTGAPLAVRTRARGSVDEYARVVGRWLVTQGRLRLPRLLPPRLRLRVSRRRARVGAACSGARRPRDRLAAGGGRRARGVPRALRRSPLLRSRPDAGERRGSPPGRVRGLPARPARQRGWRGAGRHGLEPGGDGVSPRRLPELVRRAGRACRRGRPCRPLPRERRGGRTPRRRRASVRPGRDGLGHGRHRGRALPAARTGARLGRPRQPERRRPDRLSGSGPRVRRPRRAPSRGRWKPRLARAGRLGGADDLGRARRASRRGSST